MKRISAFWRIGIVTLVILSACTQPGATAPEGTPSAGTPVPTLPDPKSLPAMPPAISDTLPAAGSQIPLQAPITFYFNQPMDKKSVETAWSIQPAIAGIWTWADNSAILFTPASALPASTDLTFTLAATAISKNGQLLSEPISINFRTAEALAVVQTLPEAGTDAVSASAAVVAAFNQPVVALGADASTLPVGFTLQPTVGGKGEWLNTSTYIFYPDPALAGGITYTATINPKLSATSGSALKETKSWSFSVAMPEVQKVEPEADGQVDLDAVFTVTFNQPMDTGSVQSNFTLTGPAGKVSGTFKWNKNNTSLTFTPSGLLSRDSNYTLTLSAQAKGRGGTAIGYASAQTFHTYPGFYVQSTTPVNLGLKENYKNITISFSAPLQEENAADLIKISPEAGQVYAYANGTDLTVYSTLNPETVYTVTVSSALKDRWGQSLGQEFSFRFKTDKASPFFSFPYVGSDTFFVNAENPRLYAMAVSVPEVKLTFGSLNIEKYLSLNASGSYEERNIYDPPDATTWVQTIEHDTDNVNEPVSIQVPEEGGALTPGIYHITADPGLGGVGMFPDDLTPGVHARVARAGGAGYPQRYFIIASNVNLTIKAGTTDLLVWAVDTRTNTPVREAPISIYRNDAFKVATGTTDADGIFRTSLPAAKDEYAGYYAILGEPGDDIFSVGTTYWDMNIAPYNFGLRYDYQPAHTEVYMYSDRPIYRPGQTVYFRAVVRKMFDGVYSDAGLSSLALTLNDGYGQSWQFDLPLSSYGTAHGEFTIPEDAQPGSYYFTNKDVDLYFTFTVANYKKPSINLSVTFDPTELKNGQSLTATVNARYFFDAPTSDLPIQWTLYAASDYFYLPSYRTGTFTDGLLNPAQYSNYGGFGVTLLSGDGMTGADGTLMIEFPADKLPAFENRTTLTLEVTGQDQSGQYVSARSTLSVNPAEYYIGIRPDVWVGQAEKPIGFSVLTVDWNAKPSGSRPLHASFSSVTWERKTLNYGYGDHSYTYTPVFKELESADFTTAADGTARLEFTPTKAGTYMLDISGGGAHSQTMLWVGGKQQAVWPRLPYDQVRLTADRDTYNAGDQAIIFIPNPLGEETMALVTVERGTIRSTQVMNLGPAGTTFSLPLADADAPNIYISATLLANGKFLEGYLNLAVHTPKRILKVELTSTPTRAGPRDPVTFDVRVTDSDGKPVQGEFSLAVADLAALALADPNSLGIVEEYTKQQPLGIDTGISLAANPTRGIYFSGGRGGGGGGDVTVVRENFPDTAYWNAEIVTDQDGRASVSMTLPDNLTTWQVDVRGLTKDTRIGEAQAQIVATKDLLVRPVTPRFLLAGDHIEVGAVVHNNTADKMEVEVSLAATNFNLDPDSRQTQKVTIASGGRTLVTWWGTAQDAVSADLVFSAEAGKLSDASMPESGPIPIRHYIAPQTFSTAGILSTVGSKLEAVSLPRSFDPVGGSLTVELSPSLAASILSGLDALEEPPSTASNEWLLSYLLPNLEVYRALQAAGLDNAALRARVETKLQSALKRLISHQNYYDNGWTWYALSGWEINKSSDPYLTAYVYFGLNQARQAGFTVDDKVLSGAHDFLFNALSSDEVTKSLDLRAFIVFALSETGNVPFGATDVLISQNTKLSPWAQALLALTLAKTAPGDTRADSLLSNLQATVIRSATGAHWESHASDWRTPSDTLVTTAMVAYALGQKDPASPLLADVVRYLSAQRNAAGCWGTPFESAWIILALNSYMVGTGGYAADYTFDATLNNQPLAEGQAAGPGALTPVLSTVPITTLLPDYPNALTIHRSEGNGSLYYRAALQVFQPVELVQPLEKGMRIERNFYLGSCTSLCQPIHSIQLAEGSRLTVKLTLTLPTDVYYLNVADYLPAGTEVLDTSLKTSQQGEGSGTDVTVYDPADPFANGWGWWYFQGPLIYDDHVTWTADYLSAGTYVLSYTLIPMQAGEFRVIPARAWLTFFPEVQGITAGEIFEIKR
jgi:alpha-2-macroglobulin